MTLGKDTVSGSDIKGQYILQAMKKIQENGCILAAHQFR
jgi:hypothetical protein